MKTMLNVNLLDGIYKASQEKGNEYLLYLDIDRLVSPCYEAVSQTPKKPRYGGWESRGISGHSMGTGCRPFPRCMRLLETGSCWKSLNMR